MNKQQIKQCVDNDIRKLFTVFRRNPAMFLDEADVQCYLYSLLANDRTLRTFRPAVKDTNFKTILVHAEPRTTRRRYDIVIARPRTTFNVDDWKRYICIEIKFNKTYTNHKTCNVTRDIKKAQLFEVGYVLWLNWQFCISEEHAKRAENLAKKYGNVTFLYMDRSMKPIKTNVL